MIEWVLIIGTVIPTICYACVSIAMLINGNYAAALTWGAYAAANVGLIKTYGIL